MKVKDLMTKNVEFVDQSKTVSEAAHLMKKFNVGSIPVCDKDALVGIVTDRDIVIRNIAYGHDPKTTSVKDVMTSNVTTVSPDMEITDVSRMMADSQIRRIPVVNNNMLVGIVALGDVAINAKYDTEVSETLTEISLPTTPN